jgi:GH35 family endo-1,4-beta-xylanase
MAKRIDRREFARRAAGLAAVAAGANIIGPQTVRAASTAARPELPKGPARTLKVAMVGADGKAVGEWQRNSLYVADLHFEPERQKSSLQADGTVEIAATLPRVALHAKIPVPGFGDAWVKADNEGEGYASPDSTLDFVYEAAKSRLAEVDRFLKASSAPFSAECRAHRDAAAEALTSEPGESAARRRMQALAHGLWAGELAVVEHARHAIAAREARRDFLFGCNAFKYRADGPYAEHFKQVMNYATLPFYLGRLEAAEGNPDYARIDQILEWCERSHLRPKGHPLWWGHEAGIPKWLAGADWDAARRHCERVVARSVDRYKGRINYWDVINEAHDWANGLKLTQEQEIEITRLCCDAARAKNDRATIVVNNCCPFGEYAAQGRVYKGPVYERILTPLAYLEWLLASGVQFDVIGVQIYFPNRDMMAISQLLDEYARFKKPVHITELGVRSQRPSEPAPAEWHHPWSESVQADWMEWFYTMAYARPEIGAITWWDFSDPAFIPTGGFLREDNSPKEMFFRLRALKEQWKLA